VVVDLKVMKIKQWMEKMKDREKWRLIVEYPRITQGCSFKRKEGRKDILSLAVETVMRVTIVFLM